ncbi:MAG TPA: hypothetical protein DCL35_04415 [Candidatus Omnitrophica bacterium]|nr:hypothetical protein [Candidatus Omnitrophota bacterium]
MRKFRVNVLARVVYSFVVLTIMFLLIFISFRDVERRAAISLFQKNAGEKEAVFDKLLKLKSASIQTLVFDYTYWDEMLAAVTEGDISWAQTNVPDSALSTYEVDSIRIYNINKHLFYSINNIKDKMLQEMGLPSEVFDGLLRKRFDHFFLKTSAGLMEVRAATIHPSEDEKRETAPQGFLFAGRLWSDKYIKGLSDITECSIALNFKVKEGGGAVLDFRKGVITFSRDLPGWDGKAVGHLTVKTVSREIRDFNEKSRYYFTLIFVFAGILAATALFAIIGWIFFPLYSISRALRSEDLKHIQGLKEEKTEFGDIARSICEWKKAEEKIENLQKMKDSLTQMIAHDLNNPLQVISGNIELAGMELQGQDAFSADIKDSFYWIAKSAQDMKNMISNLLDINKMEEGKFNLRPGQIRLDDVLEQVAGVMKVLAQKEGKMISVHVSQGLDSLSADEDVIKRVISNLIGNALKFTPAGTVIEVAARKDKIESEAIVSVADHGDGIPEAYLSKVFDKFVQVENDLAIGRLGKGLGLAFCKMAVEAHGGRIWVESELGKGSTFYFALPIRGIADRP